MEASQHIKNKPEILRNTMQSMLHRAQLCIEIIGGHFEHLTPSHH